MKPYGEEYRVLSNKWVSTKSLQRFVYRNTKAAVHALVVGNECYRNWGEVRSVIDDSLLGRAAELMGFCKIKTAPGYPVTKGRKRNVG